MRHRRRHCPASLTKSGRTATLTTCTAIAGALAVATISAIAAIARPIAITTAATGSTRVTAVATVAGSVAITATTAVTGSAVSALAALTIAPRSGTPAWSAVRTVAIIGMVTGIAVISIGMQFIARLAKRIVGSMFACHRVNILAGHSQEQS